mgnify:CR=1 FL=1
MRKTRVIVALGLLVAAAGATRLAASDPGTGDWPMWGGTPFNNYLIVAERQASAA